MNMISFSPGALLAQTRPAGTSLVTLLSPVTVRTEITLILAAVSTNNTSVAIHHDQGGETFDNSNLIINRAPAIADSDVVFQAQGPGTGIMLDVGDSLGVQIGVADDVTISVYGVTQTLANRQRG